MPTRNNFTFVLFKPQSAGNIGAAARALKNMGFDDLRLVAPGTLNQREAVAMAVHADAMLARMAEALVSIGFIDEQNPDHIMFALREIFGRSGLTPREVEILNGMARQIRWVAEGGSQTLADKRRSGKKLR